MRRSVRVGIVVFGLVLHLVNGVIGTHVARAATPAASAVLSTGQFPMLKRAALTRATWVSPGDCCPPLTGSLGCGTMDDGRMVLLSYCYCADLSGHVYVVNCNQ